MQALLPEALIPFSLLKPPPAAGAGAGPASDPGWGAVLCGDPRQLGPVVRSQVGLRPLLSQFCSAGPAATTATGPSRKQQLAVSSAVMARARRTADSCLPFCAWTVRRGLRLPSLRSLFALQSAVPAWPRTGRPTVLPRRHRRVALHAPLAPQVAAASGLASSLLELCISHHAACAADVMRQVSASWPPPRPQPCPLTERGVCG